MQVRYGLIWLFPGDPELAGERRLNERRVVIRARKAGGSVPAGLQRRDPVAEAARQRAAALENLERRVQVCDELRRVAVETNNSRLDEQAFKLDRDNYELSFFLGEMFFNDGNLDRAKQYLERTLEVQPDHFDAAVFYGVLLHERQDLKGAERWLRRAIQISQRSASNEVLRKALQRCEHAISAGGDIAGRHRQLRRGAVGLAEARARLRRRREALDAIAESA